MLTFESASSSDEHFYFLPYSIHDFETGGKLVATATGTYRGRSIGVTHGTRNTFETFCAQKRSQLGSLIFLFFSVGS